MGKLKPLAKYVKRFNKDSQKGVIKIVKGERWGYKVQLMMNLPGKKVAVSGKDKELLSAVDTAYAKMARVVRKYGEKLKRKK